MGLFIPTIFEILREVQHHTTFTLTINDPELNTLSFGVAITLLIVYVLGLVYSFTQKRNNKVKKSKLVAEKEIKWSLTCCYSCYCGKFFGYGISQRYFSGCC